jgi:hypothetical protein
MRGSWDRPHFQFHRTYFTDIDLHAYNNAQITIFQRTDDGKGNPKQQHVVAIEGGKEANEFCPVE